MDGSFSIFDVAGAGLEAQRIRAETVMQNIANAQVTRTDDGGPYRRQTVRFESVLTDARDGLQRETVRAERVDDDTTPFVVIEDAGHPDAVDGRVTLPNVDLATEMVDLMDASRKYEANLAMLRNWRELMRRTLEITR